MRTLQLICILIFISIHSFAQANYEIFGVNRVYGIVETESLKEVLPPIYSKRIYYGEDHYGFFKDSNTIIFHSKNDNSTIEFEIPKNNYFVHINHKVYLHTYIDNKSVLLDSKLNKHAQFNKRYKQLYSENYKSNFIVGDFDDKFDVFHFSNLTTPFITITNSPKYYYYYYNNKSYHSTLIHTFFGTKETYFYNDSFQLIHTLDQHIETEKGIRDSLKISDYKFICEYIGLGGGASEELWSKNNATDQKIRYSSKEFPYSILINKNFQLSGMYERKLFLVGSKESSFEFKLHQNSAKAFIPIRYQKMMGLELVDNADE